MYDFRKKSSQKNTLVSSIKRSLLEVFNYNQILNIKKKNNINAIEILIIIAITLSFVLSDWMYSIFSFGEFIIIPLTIILFFRILCVWKFDYITWLIGVIFLLLWNIVANFIWNETFNIKAGIAGAIKIAFFALFVITAFDFFKKIYLKKYLLLSLNVSTVIVLIIGIYIMIALYAQINLPYEFFWKFGRTDYQSYFFRGPSGLVRMRSIFNEPAHLGYFFNVILGLNLFSSIKIKRKWIFNLLLVVGLIATFSYSAIGIMVFQFLLFFFMKVKFKEVSIVKYRSLVAILILLTIMFVFKDILYETIYLRTMDIVAGRDQSFIERVAGSWQYISSDKIINGNGIGNTGVIFNNYAYILSDFGVIGFLFFLLINAILLFRSPELGLLYILLNFQRGGYLGPTFWILLMLFLVFSANENENQSQTPMRIVSSNFK